MENKYAILRCEIKAARYISRIYKDFTSVQKTRGQIWSVDVLDWILGQLDIFDPIEVMVQLHFVQFARVKRLWDLGDKNMNQSLDLFEKYFDCVFQNTNWFGEFLNI